MKKAFLWVICVVAVLGMALPVQAFEVGVRGYYWFPEFRGNVKVDAGGVGGTNIDFEDDLNVDNEYYPVIEAFLGVGDHHLSAAYHKADYSGSRTLTRDITFNGVPFEASTLVASSLEYDVYDVMYRYDLIDLENFLAGGSLGLVARVEVFDGDVGIKSDSADEKVSFTAPIPMLGANLHVGVLVDILEARVLVTGMSYGGGTVLDGQAEISLTPIPFVDIHGGYRLFTIDADVDDVEFDYDTAGPYAAITVSF